MNPTHTTHSAPKRVFVTLSLGSHLDLKQAGAVALGSAEQTQESPGTAPSKAAPPAQ